MDDTLVLLLIFGILFLIVGIPLIKGISEYKQAKDYYRLQEKRREYKENFLNKIEATFKDGLSAFVCDISDIFKVEKNLNQIENDGFQIFKKMIYNDIFNIFSEDVRKKFPMLIIYIGCYLFYDLKDLFSIEYLQDIAEEHFKYLELKDFKCDEWSFVFARCRIIDAINLKIEGKKRVCI